jgi:hypothetical protein
MRIERLLVKRVLIPVCVVAVIAAGAARGGWADGWPQPITAQANPPGILFSTLLDNITVNANGGWVKIGTNMVAVFLPEGAEGRMVLNDGAGSEICHWEWSARRDGFNAPFQTINFRNAMTPAGEQYNSTNLKLTRPGKYSFDFFVSGKKFYTYPVSIHEVKPSNAFGGEPRYLVDGDWNNWGYLYIPDVTPDSNIAWKIWLREWEYEQKPRAITVDLVRDADKARIAQNRNMTSARFRHDWIRHDYQLFKPKDDSLFKGRDLLTRDGGYTLTMRMNGEVFGVWKFSIKGGKMVAEGRAVRGSSAPETFVEGGLDAFWYEKIQ